MSAASGAQQGQTPEDDREWITVKTTLPTLPLPLNDVRQWATTERLLLRPLTEDDLEATYELRSQPEVMIHSTIGKVDKDLDAARERLERYIPPNDATTFNYAICLREENDKMIGIGGLHRFVGGPYGWPEIGYMIGYKYWGKGLTTEFMHAFMPMYVALPRPSEPVPLRVARDSVPDWSGEQGQVVAEKAIAITVDYNVRSHNVLRKSGFEEYLQLEEPDIRDLSKNVQLRIFQYLPGKVLEKQKAEEEGKEERKKADKGQESKGA